MKLFISHMSALRYWRASNELQVAVAKEGSCRIRSLRDCVHNAGDAKLLKPADIGFIMSEKAPLDMLVSKTARRHKTQITNPHVWTTTIPFGSFCQVGERTYVSTPEFMFLQLASVLDMVELARLGNELCGGYSLRFGHGYDERNKPLTTKTRLTDFLLRAGDAYGAKKALECLQWIADGCVSPQETNVLLALCLPRRLGGFNLPLPKVNPKIEVGERLCKFVNGEYYKPDFLWEIKARGIKVRVTVEYDSDQEHNFGFKAEYTRIRRNDFKTMGYLVTSINNSQMKDAALFEIAARQVARDLRLKRMPLSIGDLSRLSDLLEQLRNLEVR